MKVLSSSNNKPEIKWPIKHTCLHCDSLLLVDEEDVREGYMGFAVITCPVCMHEEFLDEDNLNRTVTAETVKFPENFWYFGGKDCKELNEDDIREYIKRAVKYFRENPDNFCYQTGTGDTMVYVLNFSGDQEYDVVVCKGYYETHIPFEDIDQELVREELWSNKGVCLHD